MQVNIVRSCHFVRICSCVLSEHACRFLSDYEDMFVQTFGRKFCQIFILSLLYNFIQTRWGSPAVEQPLVLPGSAKYIHIGVHFSFNFVHCQLLGLMSDHEEGF